MAQRLGIGRTLVDYKEIPELDGYQFIGLDARPDWIAANAAIAEKVIRSVVEAQRAIVERPLEVAKRLKEGSMSQNDQREIEDFVDQGQQIPSRLENLVYAALLRCRCRRDRGRKGRWAFRSS